MKLKLNSGEAVSVDWEHILSAHLTAWSFSGAALLRIDSQNRQLIVQSVEFPVSIGYNEVVETDPVDKIEYRNRPGREWPSRFAPERQSERSNLLTVVLRKEETGYRLLTCWIGPVAPPEPADPAATPESAAYWSTHAFASVPEPAASRE